MGNDNSVPSTAEVDALTEPKVDAYDGESSASSLADPKDEKEKQVIENKLEGDPPALEAEKEIIEKDSSFVKEDVQSSTEHQEKTVEAEESVVMVPAVPLTNQEPIPFSWDNISVERQTQHYLFLLGMVLGLAELADGVSEDRCTSQTVIEAFKQLSPAVSAQDMLRIAILCKDDTYLFQQDTKRAERSYPRNMLLEWQSWVSAGHGLLTNDMVIHTMIRHNRVVCAVCVSQETNSVTIVLGYHCENPDPAGTRSYEIERDTGRSVGVDATWGDVLSGTRDDDSTLGAEILQEVAKHDLSPPVRFAIVGHEGGGALATILGFVLGAAREDPIHVWTFGAPAVGDARFHKSHAMLEQKGKLRHVRVVNSSTSPTLSGKYFPVGVPLELDASTGIQNRNELADDTSKTLSSEAPNLASCSSGSAAQEDGSLAEYWQRLLSLEIGEVSLEAWYQKTPPSQRETKSKTKKPGVVVVFVVVALILGVCYQLSTTTKATKELSREERYAKFLEQVEVAKSASSAKKVVGGGIGNASSDTGMNEPFAVAKVVNETLEKVDSKDDLQNKGAPVTTEESSETDDSSEKGLDSTGEEEAEEETDAPSAEEVSSDDSGERETVPVAAKESAESNGTSLLDKNVKMAVQEGDLVKATEKTAPTTEETDDEAESVTAEKSPEKGYNGAESINSEETTESNVFPDDAVSSDDANEAAPAATKELTELNDTPLLDENAELAVDDEDLVETPLAAERETPILEETVTNDETTDPEPVTPQDSSEKAHNEADSIDSEETTESNVTSYEELPDDAAEALSVSTDEETETVPVITEESPEEKESTVDATSSETEESSPETSELNVTSYEELPDDAEEALSVSTDEETETEPVITEESPNEKESTVDASSSETEESSPETSELNVTSYEKLPDDAEEALSVSSAAEESTSYSETEESSPRPFPTRFFNVGKAFAKRLPLLLPQDIQQWVSSVVASHSLKNESQHVVDGWEARYWYSKHYSSHEALEAVKDLHSKLISSMET